MRAHADSAHSDATFDFVTAKRAMPPPAPPPAETPSPSSNIPPPPPPPLSLVPVSAQTVSAPRSSLSLSPAARQSLTARDIPPPRSSSLGISSASIDLICRDRSNLSNSHVPGQVTASQETVTSSLSLKANEMGLTVKEYTPYEAKRLKDEERDRKRVKKGIEGMSSGATLATSLGTSDGPNCLTIFSNPTASAPVAGFALGAALNQTDDSGLVHYGSAIDVPAPASGLSAWTNLVDRDSASSVDTAVTFATSVKTVTYRYVVVSWYVPAKVTAKLDVSADAGGVGYVLATRGRSPTGNNPASPFNDDFVRTPAGAKLARYDGGLLGYQALNGSFSALAAGSNSSSVPNSAPSPYFLEAIVPLAETRCWFPLASPISVSLSNGGFQRRHIQLNLLLDDASVLIQGILNSSAIKALSSNPAESANYLYSVGNLMDSSENGIYLPVPSFTSIQAPPSAIICQEKFIINIASQNIMLQLSIYATGSNDTTVDNVVQWCSNLPVSGTSVSVVPGWFNSSTMAKETRPRTAGILMVPKIDSFAFSDVGSTVNFMDISGNIVMGRFTRTYDSAGTILIRCDAFAGWAGECLSSDEVNWNGYEDASVWFLATQLV
ncbi:hypothetical protein HDU84_002793 [Entophlyctis sp. JEL0112]|nr:hypothetical protein HDU84_002793 [Entophlyctis sp. JEL0112]